MLVGEPMPVLTADDRAFFERNGYVVIRNAVPQENLDTLVSAIWNFLGMALSGLAFALAGGCPGRQLFLSGEGDGDAGVFVLGMVTGAGLADRKSVV